MGSFRITRTAHPFYCHFFQGFFILNLKPLVNNGFNHRILAKLLRKKKQYRQHRILNTSTCLGYKQRLATSFMQLARNFIHLSIQYRIGLLSQN